MQHPRLLMLCWLSVDALLMLSWRSVDALLTLCWRSLSGEAISTLTKLPIKAANTSILDTHRSTALRSYEMQHPKYLMHCWRSVDALLTLCWGSFFAVETTIWTILPIKVANTSIIGKSCSIVLELYKMQHPKLLTLCWRSVDTLLTLICSCSNIDIDRNAYKGGQNFDDA